MPQDNDRSREIDEEDRKRRQQALRSLAQGDASGDANDASSVTPSNASAIFTLPSPRHRWWIAALAVTLCAVALASLGYFAFFRPTGARPMATPTPVVASIRENNLACMKAMAVSPDGASVAILGYRHSCPSDDPESYAYQPGQVNIYSTKTDQFITSIHPDDPIASALHPQVPSRVHPAPITAADTSHATIRYWQMFWSPDSSQLVVAFSFPAYSSPLSTPGAPANTEGVLITDIQVTRTRVLAQTISPFTVYTGVWNITTGAYIPIPAGVDQGNWAPVPPALSYTWDSTDTLIPQGPALSPTTLSPAPTPGPIGTPIGGSAFTMWQTTQAQFAIDQTSSPLPSPVPGLFLLSTDFPMWSPGGTRLLLAPFLFTQPFAVLVSKGYTPPTADVLASLKLRPNTPLLPMRDKGLAAALASLKPFQGTNGAPTTVTLAWRPDGRVLAALIPPASRSGQIGVTPAVVKLYDCATGNLLDTLREQTPPGLPDASVYLSWTPDGSHLLLLDTGASSLIFWGPDQLPKK
jgi:hypothetical protein